MSPKTLDLLVEQFNKGQPIPEVEQEDIRIALAFFSDLSKGARAESGKPENPLSSGFLLHELEERCGPQGDAFSIAIRSTLLKAILQAHEEALDDHERNTLLREIAQMPLVASDLSDPESVFARVTGRTRKP